MDTVATVEREDMELLGVEYRVFSNIHSLFTIKANIIGRVGKSCRGGDFTRGVNDFICASEGKSNAQPFVLPS